MRCFNWLILIASVFPVLVKGGCTDIRVSSNVGIEVICCTMAPQKDTAYIAATDSLFLTVGTNYCPISLISIKVNGADVPYYFHAVNGSSFYVRLLGIPGRYEIVGSRYGLKERMYFDLILNPVGLDDQDIHFEKTFRIFPNPCSDRITLISASLALSSVEIFNSDLKLLKTVECFELYTLDLPINDFPQSIYYLKVATASKRTALRKIIVN